MLRYNGHAEIFKEDYQKYLIQITKALNGISGIHSGLIFETIVFCYVMFDFAVFSWGDENTVGIPYALQKKASIPEENRKKLAKALLPYIFSHFLTKKEDRVQFDKRVADYYSILQTGSFRGDWLSYDKNLIKNYEKRPILVLIGAYGDFLINPACTLNYFKAPYYENPNIEEFSKAMIEISEVSIEMYNDVYSVKDIHDLADEVRIRSSKTNKYDLREVFKRKYGEGKRAGEHEINN